MILHTKSQKIFLTVQCFIQWRLASKRQQEQKAKLIKILSKVNHHKLYASNTVFFSLRGVCLSPGDFCFSTVGLGETLH